MRGSKFYKMLGLLLVAFVLSALMLPVNFNRLFINEFYFLLLLMIFAAIGLFAMASRIRLSWMLFAVFFSVMLLNALYVFYASSGNLTLFLLLIITGAVGFTFSVTNIGPEKKKKIIPRPVIIESMPARKPPAEIQTRTVVQTKTVAKTKTSKRSSAKNNSTAKKKPAKNKITRKKSAKKKSVTKKKSATKKKTVKKSPLDKKSSARKPTSKKPVSKASRATKKSLSKKKSAKAKKPKKKTAAGNTKKTPKKNLAKKKPAARKSSKKKFSARRSKKR